MSLKLRAKRIPSGDKVVRLTLSGRGSFLHLLDPNEFEGKTNYMANIIIPKAMMQDGMEKTIRQGIKDALEIGKSTKFGGKIPKNPDNPLREGDDKFEENPDLYDAYQDAFYMVAKKPESQGKPNLFDKYGEKVTEAGVLESGYWFAFDVNLYAFNKAGNKGVAVGLNAVRLIKEDEKFAGGPSAESSADAFEDAFGDDFGEVSDEDLDFM